MQRMDNSCSGKLVSTHPNPSKLKGLSLANTFIFVNYLKHSVLLQRILTANIARIVYNTGFVDEY